MSKALPIDVAYEKLKDIDNYKELKKNKLTHSEYRSCLVIMTEIMVYGKSTTFIKHCADFFKKCNLKVIDSADGVYFEIYGEKEK